MGKAPRIPSRKPTLDGQGQWANSAIVTRYRAWCRRLHTRPTDISTGAGVFADRDWAYPMISQVLQGVLRGDPACAWIGIELIEEDGSFALGMIMKTNMARALRQAPALDDMQKHRIRARLLAMLRAAYLPREFRQYSRLGAHIGLGELRPLFEALEQHPNPWTRWYARYLTTGTPGPRPD